MKVFISNSKQYHPGGNLPQCSDCQTVAAGQVVTIRLGRLGFDLCLDCARTLVQKTETVIGQVTESEEANS